MPIDATSTAADREPEHGARPARAPPSRRSTARSTAAPTARPARSRRRSARRPPATSSTASGEPGRGRACCSAATPSAGRGARGDRCARDRPDRASAAAEQPLPTTIASRPRRSPTPSARPAPRRSRVRARRRADGRTRRRRYAVVHARSRAAPRAPRRRPRRAPRSNAAHAGVEIGAGRPSAGPSPSMGERLGARGQQLARRPRAAGGPAPATVRVRRRRRSRRPWSATPARRPAGRAAARRCSAPRCAPRPTRGTPRAGRGPPRASRPADPARRAAAARGAASPPSARHSARGALPQHVLLGRRPHEQRDRDATRRTRSPSRPAAPAGRRASPGSITARMNDEQRGLRAGVDHRADHAGEQHRRTRPPPSRRPRASPGVATSVPSVISTTPASAEHQVRAEPRGRVRRGSSTNSSSANEPNAANVATWALPISCEPIAKLIGTTTAARSARLEAPRFGSCASTRRRQPRRHVSARGCASRPARARAGPGTGCSTGWCCGSASSGPS